MEIDYEKTLQNIETLRKLISKKYHKELSKLEKNENDFYIHDKTLNSRNE